MAGFGTVGADSHRIPANRVLVRPLCRSRQFIRTRRVRRAVKRPICERVARSGNAHAVGIRQGKLALLTAKQIQPELFYFSIAANRGKRITSTTAKGCR
jgi:hypothetical protein